MRKVLALAIAAALPFAAVGCGEQQAVTIYKQGQYQGKRDKEPWDNDQFKGDKVAWEKAVKARNDGQNEYTRVSGS
jgi:hypothetical protein